MEDVMKGLLSANRRRAVWLVGSGVVLFWREAFAAFRTTSNSSPIVPPRILKSPLVPFQFGPRKLEAGFESYISPSDTPQLVRTCRRLRLLEDGIELTPVELAEVVQSFSFESISDSGNKRVSLRPDAGCIGVHSEMSAEGYQTSLEIVLRESASELDGDRVGETSAPIRVSTEESLIYAIS